MIPTLLEPCIVFEKPDLYNSKCTALPRQNRRQTTILVHEGIAKGDLSTKTPLKRPQPGVKLWLEMAGLEHWEPDMHLGPLPSPIELLQLFKCSLRSTILNSEQHLDNSGSVVEEYLSTAMIRPMVDRNPSCDTTP